MKRAVRSIAIDRIRVGADGANVRALGRAIERELVRALGSAEEPWMLPERDPLARHIAQRIAAAVREQDR